MLFALIMGGCSYHPGPEPVAERETLIHSPVEAATDVTGSSVSDSETAQTPAPAPRPRKRLGLPPAPKDEELNLEPARAIMIRLPSAP